MKALLTQMGDGNHSSLHDPIEDHPDLTPIFAQTEQRVEKELEGEERGRGFCHLYWHTKKRILREEFGVEWFPPSQMNPHVIFD
jgi:hypothetical protein